MSESFSYEDAGKAAPAAAKGEAFSYEKATGETPARGLKGWGQDIAATAVKGAIAVPEAAVGIADLVTGGAAGKFLENADGAVGFRPKQAREMVNDWHSDATLEAQQKFQQADGVVDKAVTAIQNPSLIATAIGESLPAMGAGGVAARGLLAGTRLAQMGAKGAALAGAAGEGVVGAGSAAEQIRQETDDGLLSPGQTAAAAATGAATTAFGALGGRVAQRLGIGDAETMMAQGSQGVGKQIAADAANPLLAQAPKSIPRQVIEGAISEGLLEELPQSLAEQLFQNIALDKPWHEDLDAAAVMGVLSGGAMGGAAAGYHGFREGRAPGAGEGDGTGPVNPAAPGGESLLALPAPTITVGSDGEARTAEDRNARLQRLATGDVTDVTPVPERPSAAMGIDPAAGPLSAGAALAVDTGITDQVQLSSAAERAGEKPGKDDKGEQIEAPAALRLGANPDTGEIDAPTTMADWSDAQLSEVFRNAQGASVRRQLGAELARRKAEKRAAEAQSTKKAPTDAAPAPATQTPGARTAPASTATPVAAAPAPGGSTQGAGNSSALARAGVTDAAPSQNPGAQAAAAPGAQGQTENPAQRGQRITSAGEAWTRMPTAERQAVASRLEGLKPVLQKNLAGAQWANLNTDLKGKIADAISPAPVPVAAPAADVRIRTSAPAAPFAPTVVAAAADEAATSVANDLPEPTAAQKEAGNYRKGHARVNGLDISIENPAGTKRRPEWPPLANHYGYIRGSVGADKDHVDVFMTDRAEDPALPVFVVDQNSRNGKFDEHKVVMGAADEAEARATYLANYSKGWTGLGGITQMTQDEFKAWVKDPAKTAVPLAARVDKPAVSVDTPAPAANKAPVSVDMPAAAPAEPARDKGGNVIQRPKLAGDDRIPYQDHRSRNPAEKAAQERVVDYMNGDIDRPTLMRELEASNLEEGVVYAITQRLQSDGPSVGEVDRMMARQQNAAAPGTAPAQPDTTTGAAAARQKAGKGKPENPGAGTAETGAGQFAGNKLFTADKVAAARERMRKKLGTLNSGIDPELLVDGMTIAGAYVESGIRNFADFATAMIGDMGDGVVPYLRSFWEGVRAYPGLDTEGMTSPAVTEGLHKALMTPAVREAAPELGEEVAKPAKRTRKTGARGDMTLTQDWGVEHIDGYGDDTREVGNTTKDAFLKEARQYLDAVAAGLADAGFEPHPDRKGKPGKAVNVNESGAAGSGEVSLTMRHPDTETNVYVHVGDTALRGMFPSTASGIAVMGRTSQGAGDTYANKGQNRWMPVDLAASDLAGLVLADARAKMTGQTRTPTEITNGNPEQAGRAADQGRAPAVPGSGGRNNGPAAQPDTENLASQQPGDVPAPADAGSAGSAGVRVPAEDVGAAGPADKGGNAGDGRPRASGAREPDARPRGRNRVKAPEEVSPANPGPGNFHIDNPLEIVGGGQVARFDKNQAAIELLGVIREASRTATAEEQRVLAGYTGWGSFGQELFQGTWDMPKPKDGWQKRDAWLRDHLGKEEWQSAQRSITNAHYTDPPTVMAMWDMVRRMGFDGGRVLEPSMGIGNFFGMMPADIKGRSQLAGIELDQLTGSMAKQLYPDANVKVMGYQDSKTPDGFYDVVIGNWPFENTVIADRRYNTLSPFLHDYFFLKAVDQVRAGGLVVGITSNGTMDKKATKIRAALARKAEFVTAIRLPSGAFQEYAGTKVVTDIVILKKREQPLSITPADPWIQSVAVKTPAGPEVFINEFFAKTPGNIIGTTDWGHGTTRMQPGMIVHRPENMAERLRQAVDLVPQDVFAKVNRTAHLSFVTNHTADREGSLTEQGGQLMVVRGEHLAPAQEVRKYALKSEAATAKREQELRGLVGMRKLYAALIEAERNDTADAPRAALRESFEAFESAHGPLADSFGLDYLRKIDDPFYPALAALSVNGKPSAILSKSTIRGARTIDNPTPQDAYVLARNRSVEPSLAEIAAVANKPEAEVRDALVKTGAVFDAPAGGIVPSDIYLSGNVRQKLREAQAALAEGNQAMARNVAELQAVVPADIPYFNIESQLGATWVPAKAYAEYVAHMLNRSADGIDATFLNGRWKVRLPDAANNAPEARTGFGTIHYPFSKLVNAAFTNQTVKIRRKDSDGNEFVDVEATDEANARIGEIRGRFAEWLWSDPERRAALEQEYNEVRNAYATPRYDGSFLSFEGMALDLGRGPFSLRQHQANAIWRALVNRRSINAHEVGTGKTFTMGGIAVESRRYGIAKKPVVLAHNANSASVAAEIQMMYPAAKVLYVDNLSSDTIAVRMRQIANDDWDAIVLPHSLIDRLSFREDTLMAMAQDDIQSLEEEAYAAAEEDGVSLDKEMLEDEDELKKLRSVTAKELVKARNRIIETIKKQAQRSSREGAIPFEDLGIDMVLVDEAHEFKKPPISTRMNMKGLNTQTSDRSIALQFITRYIRANNFGGNVHTFTGTPITNTLTEIFHQMRYVMEDEMREAGVETWDGWFGSFAKEVQDVELSAAGEYETVNRLAGFINVPELRRMIGQYMDVVFADDMPEMQPRKVNGKMLTSTSLSERERAELLNGRTEGAADRPYKKVINVTSDLTADQGRIFARLQGYARSWRGMKGKERIEVMRNGGPESPIITEGLANKASFDVRLTEDERWAGQEGQTKDDPGSKASKVVANVLEVYATDPNANQVIFSDVGYSTSQKRSIGRNDAGDKLYRTVKTFSTIRDIVERLVQGGIPREQIAVIDGSTSKEKRKLAADAMNDSTLRVVIGSTDTLGVGVNMQRNLRAIHHLDAPYMPGELEQRNGRGLRQGNQWNTVLEYRYMTDRLDGRRWQILAIKQRFITSFMKSNSDARVIEGDAASDEESDVLQSFSEAAGDARILIREKLRKNVEALQRSERMHTNGVADARRTLRGTREAIQWNRGELAKMRAGNLPSRLQAMMAAQSDDFRMTVAGTVYDARKDAEDALAQFMGDLRLEQSGIEVGRYRDEPVTARWPRMSTSPELVLTVGGQEFTSSSLRGMEQQVRNYPGRIERVEQNIAQREASIDRLEEVSKAPFARGTDLENAQKRLADLERDIEVNPVPPPAWLRAGAPVDSTAYRNGKEMLVTGHRWNADGWFVLAQDAKGEMSVPYTEVTDAQGMPVYEEREFQAPEVIDKKAAAEASAPAAPGVAPAEDDEANFGQAPNTQAFRTWFGDSKVVDAAGAPLRVYHGTAADDFTQFAGRRIYFSADPAYANDFADGGAIRGIPRKQSRVIPAFLSLQNPLDARALGTDDIKVGPLLDFLESKGVKLPAETVEHMRATERPGSIGSEWWSHLNFLSGMQRAIAAAGYDGIIQMEDNKGKTATAYVAFRPEQVKSATGNNGAFASSSPDISEFAGRQQRQQGTPSDRAVMDMVGEGRPTRDILRLLADTSRSKFNRQVARLLLKTGVTPTVMLDATALGDGEGFQFLAKYSRQNDRLTLTPGAAAKAEQIFLHEMIHAATLRSLDRKGLASMQMRHLFDHVKRQGDAAGQYGMKNVGEFVAEAFTNPAFQETLRNMKAPAGNPLKSAWSGLVRILRGILGLNQDSEDALSRALELGVSVMREDMALRRRNAAAAPADDAYFGAPGDFERMKTSALEQIDRTLRHPGKVSLWDKSVGTMRNLAERNLAFKPVFESAQRFIDDISMLGNMAADAAPRLLPRVDSWRDLKKKPISAADNKAVARPLFEGTLMWARDVDGTPVLVDDLAARYQNLPAADKAQMLLRAGKLDARVLQMWQGMPLASYEQSVNSSFNSRMLKAGVVWSEAELKSIFGATDEQADLYKEARAAINSSIDITTRTDMLRGLGDDYAQLRDVVLAADTLDDAVELLTRTLMDDARANPDASERLTDLNNLVVTRSEKGKKLMEEGYAPLSRFGRYTVDVVDQAGERQYFGMFETMREANDMAAKMREEFKGATIGQGTMSEDAFKLFAGITPESLEQFGSMLGLDGKGDDPQDKAFQAYLQLAKNNHSALKRLIHRKGIAGYSEDVGRVLASFVYSNARLGAGGLNAGTMETAIEAIPKEQGELKDLALGLRDYIQNPQEEGQAVRGMLFAQYLGGSLASAFVNTTQPFAVTLPWLSQFGGIKKAGAAMARAMNDMRKSAMGSKTAYEPDLAAALQSAEDDGVVSPQEIHQLMAQARGAGSLRTGDGTKAGDARAAVANTWERAKVAWGQPFALAEQFNRTSTFVAAYRIAKDQGMAEPSTFARKAVLETQFLYSKANKMKFARGAVGGTLMTFKTYSVSYLELMNRMWTQGGPEGKRAVGWAVAMLLLMGGAGGLPFMEDAEDLIDGAGQLMGYNVSAKQWRKQHMEDIMGKELAGFLEQGLSGLPGAPIDVSGRLGMGNLLPGTGLFLNKPNRERDLLEIAGPAGDLVARGFTAGRKVLTGNVGAAALELAPTAVRNAAKGVDMAVTGTYKDAKGYKVIDTTLAEAVAKGIGFQPKSVAEVQEANSFMQRTKSFYTATSSEIKAQWADALFRKDDDALAAVRERLDSWNRNNPEQRITVSMPGIWKRVREMGKDRTQRIAETAPKALRQQMRGIAAEL